ncbi:MAG: hypothetical protein HS115_06765 [Spirochaetales bacterium]|nr:hypothetical protein [Spirochaetales bacterium]
MKRFWQVYSLSGWVVAFLVTLALIKEKQSLAGTTVPAGAPERSEKVVPARPTRILPDLPAQTAVRTTIRVSEKAAFKTARDAPAGQAPVLPKPLKEEVPVKKDREIKSPPQQERILWPKEVQEAAQLDQPVVRSGFEREEFRPGPERLIYVKPHALFPEGGWIRYRRYSDIQDNGQEKVRFYTASGHKVVERAAVEWNEEIRVE